MGENNQWIDEISVLIPTRETYVRINEPFIQDGVIFATAKFDKPLGDSSLVQIGWRFGVNDFPVAGQYWQIRVLGFDHPSQVWIAQALIRES